MGSASCTSAHDKGGLQMPLIAFRENVDERRFRRLARLLQGIQTDMERESAELRRSAERMTESAAFSLAAMENGDNPERMAAKIDTLTRNLAMNRMRQVSLQQQLSILDRTRARLSRILPSHRA